MRKKIESAKTFVKENKAGIAVLSGITIVYGSYFATSVVNYKTMKLQYEIEMHSSTEDE